MKKDVLFVDVHQFGQLTDLVKWCEYLKGERNIRVLCFDKGKQKVIMPGVNVTYLHYYHNKAIRGIYFLLVASLLCLFYQGFIFVEFFPKCYLLKKFLRFKKMHIDYRTLSIHKDKKLRIAENADMQRALSVYDTASFISEGIKNQMCLREGQKFFILPLGADIISLVNKSFDQLNLLYIGTLRNRRIIDTVKGVEIFIMDNPSISINYDIVGDGDELEDLKNYVASHNLSKYVKLYGRKPYNELKQFLDKDNIGISYIPIVDYYQHQPPTKTFEYILSGLYCVATDTDSNREVINNNGILINDDPESFANSLNAIYDNQRYLDSEKIRNTLLDYQWKEIIKKHLIPIVEL